MHKRRADDLCFANILTAVRITTQTCASRPGRRRFRPSDDVDDLIEQRETQNCRRRSNSRRANHLRLFIGRRGQMEAPDERNLRTPWGQLQLPTPSEGPCLSLGVCVYDPEGDPGRPGSQETCAGAKEANRQLRTDWRRTAHRVTTKPGETTNHRRRRHFHRPAHTMTSPARRTSIRRGGSQKMYAKSVTV